MASGGGEEPKKLKLYPYWRSSCSWRVRISLNLKGLDYECIPINLFEGENRAPEFLKLNPLGCIPVLVDGDTVVADSFAIALYLEVKYPQHPLLPQDLQKKELNYQVICGWLPQHGILFLTEDYVAFSSAFYVYNISFNLICSSTQPYHNLPVIGYIKEKLGPNEMLAWVNYHINSGFEALEKLLGSYAWKYATGGEPFLVDVFLAPQIGTANRFNLDMIQFHLLSEHNEAYKEHPAFQNALPGKQPDASRESRD